MKKTLLSFAMLFSVVGAWAQVEFTFTRGDNNTATVTAPEGLTATIESTSISNTWNTGGAMANRKDVLCPNTNTNATSEANPITFTLTVNGLTPGQLFTAAEFTHIAVNSGGNLQPSNNTDVRHCNFKLEANGAVVKTLTDQNIWIPSGSTDKVITLNEHFTANEEGALTLTLTIYKGTNNNGCFYGLTKIKLANLEELTYTFTDNAGNQYTGTYQGIAGETEPTISGVAGYSLSNTVWNDNTFTATINFPFPVSKIEGTTNWTFIRSYQMTDGKAYIYVNGENKVVSKSEHRDNGTYGYYPTSEEGELQKWMWAIYPRLADGKFTFQIKNASTNKYAPHVSGETTDFSVSETAGDYCWGTCTSNRNGFNLDGTNLFFGVNSSSSGEKNAIIWNKNGNTHQGCNLEFVNPIYSTTVKFVDNGGNEYSYLTTVNYTADETDVERPNDISNFERWITDIAWNGGICNINVTFPFAISSENTLNPLVIAIDRDAKKSFVAQKIPGSSERYVRVTEYNKENGYSEDPELGYGQWAIYPTLTDNKFGFKIKNIATETYIYANSANAEYPVTLNNDGTTFDFVIGNDSLLAYNDGADTRYLSVPTNDDYGCPVGVSPIDEGRKAIIFPEFKRYTVNIGATGYTTLYTPFTVMAEAESGKKVEVYTIKEDIQPDDTLVHLTQMDAWNSIPANSACILRLTEVDEDGKEVKLTSGRVTCVKADDYVVKADWSGNLLKGSDTNSYVEGKAYVLSAPDGPESVGMYWATLNKDANGAAGSTHFKNNSGKAYILAPKDADGNVRFLAFNFGGEETGIIETENENLKMENAEVYDLAGRRVQGAQKGIFIVNGKLVIK